MAVWLAEGHLDTVTISFVSVVEAAWMARSIFLSASFKSLNSDAFSIDDKIELAYWLSLTVTGTLLSSPFDDDDDDGGNCMLVEETFSGAEKRVRIPWPAETVALLLALFAFGIATTVSACCLPLKMPTVAA